MTYPLPNGSALAGGTVEELTLTAYIVRLPDGGTSIVPFTVAHPPVPAKPLVTFGGVR